MRTLKSPLFWQVWPLWAVLVGSGCAASQRAAQKLIDPHLLAEGDALTRERGQRDLQLGPYRVTGLERNNEPAGAEGPFAASESGQTRPTQQLSLRFELVGGEQAWAADCLGWRRQPADHDLAAAADEAREEVALRCELGPSEAGAPRWLLEIQGTLNDNLFGTLEPVSASRPGGTGTETETETETKTKTGKRVEILMWHRVWKISRRPLPASLATVIGAKGTEAALILSKPEQAWLAPELEPRERELALTTLAAVRLIPLGFEL